MVTKSCKGYTCVHPWSVIHAAGNVGTLQEALDKRFDNFYASVSETVSFEKCELGYILESEGPQEAAVFHERLGDFSLADGEL
jgi:N-acetylglucosamine-6-sulfatase